RRYKWFSFCFNGQITNYRKLRDRILDDPTAHLARDTDAELLLYYLSVAIAKCNRRPPDLLNVFQETCSHFDGAYTIAYMDAMGNMFVGRDPLGMKPLCYAIDGPLFAAASESNALINLGVSPELIRCLDVGELITIIDGRVEIRKAIPSVRKAHCFFEWIYFANVASTLETRSVYLARKSLGEVLADMEDVPIVNFGSGEKDLVVVPVPDTSKAAAAAMAYRLGVPCLEGLIHNRYVGRTFIEGGQTRMDRAKMKYTPLREVLEGKRILLVDDSIVRSTTMVALLKRIREVGRPKEIHVRITCPPVIAPCFYGVDMPTVRELFAPAYLKGGPLTAEQEAGMARVLGADSLRYIPVEAIEKCIGIPGSDLCCACVDGEYPTPEGRERYNLALRDAIPSCE
ncbi:MAG: phosphoribosyltransferase family protein, partial [Planctomycetia bacterium]|nr:phosphoribosyltransferase family protein [Planctomycetia bacterium]